MKKHIDTWRDLEDVHDLLTQYVAIFLEKLPADIPPEDLHTLRSLLPPCATQLLSTRSFRAYRQPRFPDAPALTALLSQLTFARLGFYFRTLLPPLFEAAVHARVSSEFSRVVEEFARTPETARGWAAVGTPRADTRGATGTTDCVLHMPSQALVVYPPIAILTNALLAERNDHGYRHRQLFWTALRMRLMSH